MITNSLLPFGGGVYKQEATLYRRVPVKETFYSCQCPWLRLFYYWNGWQG
jgi:hypothetical protein